MLGGVVAGCFCLNTILVLIENAVSSLAAAVAGGGAGLLALLLLVVFLNQIQNPPRGPHW
jgi:hypothetical protein